MRDGWLVGVFSFIGKVDNDTGPGGQDPDEHGEQEAAAFHVEYVGSIFEFVYRGNQDSNQEFQEFPCPG